MRWLVLCLALAGCVHGTPFDPNAEVCPNVVVYVSFEDPVTMSTDSIIYPQCGR